MQRNNARYHIGPDAKVKAARSERRKKLFSRMRGTALFALKGRHSACALTDAPPREISAGGFSL